MQRAFVDAPIDQTINNAMKVGIEAMLIDLIETYGVNEFCLWQHEVTYYIKKVLQKLKSNYPNIRIINIRTHDVSEFKSDDLNIYLEVDNIKEWQESNCQVRMVMYHCTVCPLYKKNRPCRRRDIIDGNTAVHHTLVKLSNYMTSSSK